jgi:hypothetical protein
MITDKSGNKCKVPLAAIALMYRLEPQDVVVYASEKYKALSPEEFSALVPIPAPCMGLYCRWQGIQDDLKAGIDNEDTRALKALLQRKSRC